MPGTAREITANWLPEGLFLGNLSDSAFLRRFWPGCAPAPVKADDAGGFAG